MKMKHFLILFLCIICFSSHSKAEKKKILVLHSYHQGLNWTDNITKGIQSVFNKYGNLEVQYEYMDSKRNSGTAYLEEFANRAFPSFNNKDLLLERAIKLLPLFQIKWCCIMMNEFMPNIAERRLFSDPDLDLEASKFYQLEKASSLLIEINY